MGDLQMGFNQMISKFKFSLPDLLRAVLAWDASVLDIEHVENLIKFCESTDEKEKLKNCNRDKEMLANCEQFLMELMEVPRIEAKLKVFGFKITFASQMGDLKSNLNTIKAATKEVKESAKLHHIMETISSIQENLGEGSKLDSLVKLSSNQMTLMHDLCKVLGEKNPELLDFSDDLVHLESVSKIELKAVAEKMRAVTKGLKKAEQELTASEKDSAISEGFRKVLKDFLETAEVEVRLLSGLYMEVGRNVDSLSQYFGEDPVHCTFEQVTKILTLFIKSFIKCREESERHDAENKMEKHNEHQTKKNIKEPI